MNRVELMRALAAHKAAAAACEKALKDQPARIFEEEGTADTWRIPGVGTLSVSLSQDSTTVTNPDMFMDWLEARYPTEVVTETVVVRKVRNPAWRDQVLASLEALDADQLDAGQGTQVVDDEDTVVPGVVRFKGGKFLHASVSLDAGLKRRYAADAVAYVERGIPMPAIAGSSAQVIEGSAMDTDPA